MSTEAENPKPNTHPRSKRGGVLRRLWQWWGGLWFSKVIRRLSEWWYDWWFPLSERPQGYHGYHGYSGASRENRVKWLWRRLRRLVRRSFAGKAVRSVSDRWYDWWHPVSDEVHGYALQGRARRHRLIRDWRRLKRWVGRSFLGRGYEALAQRFDDWWYPPAKETHPYPAYAHRRRSRLAQAWTSAKRRLHSSWVGRKYRSLAGDFYEWYFPVTEGSGGGYAYAKFHRVSRPVRFARRSMRWFRRTWLGSKLGWVLDEVEALIFQVQTRAAHTFAWGRIERWLWRWQTAVLLACLIAAIGFGYKYGLPRYRQYNEQRYARQAQQFVAKSDFARAMLRARQVLALNADNPIAIRIFADLADRFGSPHALHWRQRLVLLNADPTNRVALAKTALRAEAFPFPTATKALNEIELAFRRTSAYHLVAGALAIKLSNLQAAEQHYVEALKLNPDDPVNRMSLAVVRLQSGNARLITDSRTTLELLRTDRQLGLLATRSLVAESIARREFAQAELLSQQILTNAQVSFSDRIVHLAILHVEKSPHFKTFLGETQKHAEEHPFYVGELAAWMNRSGFAQAALDWLHELPARLTKQGLVPIVVADAYVALGAWKELAGFLETERWSELDAVRFGMMSFAFWKEFGDKRTSTVWQQAIRLAARSPTTLNTLAEMAAGWGWKEETEEVLWYAAGKNPAASWPLTALQNLYTGQRDTAGLRRVFRTLVKQDPKDRLARNNFAMVSLLLGADVAQAHASAAELHAAEPQNPVFISTYAFSLYLQGRAPEAVQALRALGLDRLDDPALAAYYGVFLSAAGETQTARSYLSKSAKAFLLPEELALVERAKKAM